MGGMINQTNYFDANTYANTTFGQFGGAPFVNNQVLPLGDSNFGFVGQYQFNDNWFLQIGGNMMDNEPRRNPFHNTTGKSFNLLGEIGWTHEKAFGIGTGTYRLQPFMFHAAGRNHGGVAFNLGTGPGQQPLRPVRPRRVEQCGIRQHLRGGKPRLPPGWCSRNRLKS